MDSGSEFDLNWNADSCANVLYFSLKIASIYLLCLTGENWKIEIALYFQYSKTCIPF
jgi:hypothetical protein